MRRQAEAAVVRDADGAPTEEPLVEEEPTKRAGAWTIAWYILLAVVVTVGIVFFVKAFIDADDVDVRVFLCLGVARGAERV